MHSLDIAIVCIYICLALWIGFKVRGSATSLSSFIGANRKVGTYLGVASMVGTEMGLITIMYSAQKGFTGGFAVFHIALIAVLVTLCVGFSGFIVQPLRELKVLTIPEFYEKRFSSSTRVLGGVLLSLGGILNMGLFLKVGAMFIVGVSGLSIHTTSLPIVMTLLLILVLIYTCLGGMISVVITDYIQFILLSAGLLITVSLSIFKYNWSTIIHTVETVHGSAGFNPLSSAGDFGWTYVLWMAITAGLVSCAIWPTAVQRALILHSAQAVKTQYLLSSVGFMARFLIPNFLGICALVMMHQDPNLFTQFFPKDGTQGLNSLYALPMYLSDLLPIGIMGLIVAGMIAAFMSTHDSYFLCWSAVITHDIIEPLMNRSLSESAKLLLTRILIILIGGYVWYWGLWYDGASDVWDYLAITGSVYFSGSCAVLIGGLYWKRANSRGAKWALLMGFTSLLGLDPIRYACQLDSFSSAELGLFSILLCIFSFILGSLLPHSSERGIQ